MAEHRNWWKWRPLPNKTVPSHAGSRKLSIPATKGTTPQRLISTVSVRRLKKMGAADTRQIALSWTWLVTITKSFSTTWVTSWNRALKCQIHPPVIIWAQRLSTASCRLGCLPLTDMSQTIKRHPNNPINKIWIISNEVFSALFSKMKTAHARKYWSFYPFYRSKVPLPSPAGNQGVISAIDWQTYMPSVISETVLKCKLCPEHTSTRGCFENVSIVIHMSILGIDMCIARERVIVIYYWLALQKNKTKETNFTCPPFAIFDTKLSNNMHQLLMFACGGT